MSAPWFDSHCHLDAECFGDDVSGAVRRAKLAGVDAFLVPGIRGDPKIKDPCPGLLRAWGFHPMVAQDTSVASVRASFSVLNHAPSAIGECGLDRLIDVPFSAQRDVFIAQLEIARHHHMPVLIHLRGYWFEALALLEQHADGVPWILHAFSGSVEIARLFIRRGALISLAGPVCCPTSKKVRGVARELPRENLLLETDAPDLAPAGWCSSINEPAALPVIAATVASLRQCTVDDLASVQWTNACRVFPALARIG